MILGSRGTPNGHLEVLISILLILGLIWVPSWDPLWRHFRDFSVIWVAKVGDTFQTNFLMILGWEYCLNAVAVCVRNIVNTMVFEWFLFFHLLGGLGELVRFIRSPVTGRSASFCPRFRFVRAVRASEAKLCGRMWNVILIAGAPGS